VPAEPGDRLAVPPRLPCTGVLRCPPVQYLLHGLFGLDLHVLLGVVHLVLDTRRHVDLVANASMVSPSCSRVRSMSWRISSSHDERTETRPNQAEGTTSSASIVWPGQGWRKRRDSNPRVVAHRSLSRSATLSSALVTKDILPARTVATVSGGPRRLWAKATSAPRVRPQGGGRRT
jgi:hypothetical protein